MPDTLTLMQFESGDLPFREMIEMLADMIQVQGYDGLSKPFDKLATKYIRKQILDEEGNINYIALNKEEISYA
jgi:hypothetical protein